MQSKVETGQVYCTAKVKFPSYYRVIDAGDGVVILKRIGETVINSIGEICVRLIDGEQDFTWEPLMGMERVQ